MVGLALDGIRVVDFGQAGVGPLVPRYLADFGAEVIKVESSTRVEIIRRAEPFKDDKRGPDNSILFAYINQNKMSVTLNLKHPKGLELAKRLVSLADIVVENFTVGVTQRLGLTYQDLVKVKPDLIMISLTVGGQTGPYNHYKAHGPVLHAGTGLQALTGYPEGLPACPGTAPTDWFLPYVGLNLVLSALWHRDNTGQGQYIDLSDFEAAIDLLDTAVMDYQINGRTLERRGNRDPVACPQGVYRCQGEDRWCAITVKSDAHWQGLCRAMGNPAWAAAERFATFLSRRRHATELDRLMEEWTSQRSPEEVMGQLQAEGIPASLVADPRDLLTDPQLKHRNYWWEQEDPELKAFTFTSPPAVLSRTPARYRMPRPRLGEHNEYVCTQLLGLSDQEFLQCVDQGIIA